MAEVLKLIAAIEWIALGVLVLHGVKKWNKRFSDMYDDLRKEIEEMDNGR